MSPLAESRPEAVSKIELFQRLGDEIESAWGAADYDELRLPAIAKEKLAEHALPSKLTPWDVLEWAMLQPELPPQADPRSTFGDPPITVYSGARFHVDVYFWFAGTTSVHQHSFSGAFQVLYGSSIHSWHEFFVDDPVNVYMQFGRMQLRSCDLLQVGDIREIIAGRDYIHSLFHLDEPSVTIVIRTKNSPLHLPQYSYFKPHLAIDPFYTQDSMTKKLQAMRAMLRAKRPDADEKIAEMLSASDIQSTYHMLQTLRTMLRPDELRAMFDKERTDDRFDRLFEVSRRRHGPRAERLREVFERNDETDFMVERRRFVTDPSLRFFLAVLLNASGRENIYRLIGQRFPESDPQEKVLDWTFELANTRVVGLEPPNALGIDGFGDVDIAILEEMLNGKDTVGIAESLKAQGAAADDVEFRIGRIVGSPLLGPLFR